MSSSATSDILAIRDFTDAEFRLLIWLAECDGGEEMTITAAYLEARTRIPAATAAETLRSLFTSLLPAEHWSIEPVGDDGGGDFAITVTSGSFHSLRQFA